MTSDPEFQAFLAEAERRRQDHACERAAWRAHFEAWLANRPLPGHPATGEGRRLGHG